MTIIKSLEDPFVRESLFRGYNKRCVYCRNPLLFKNMQIDHVIPKSYGEERAISYYGLSPDFELDSYYNLVPSCASCNNIKRAKAYNKIQILFILNEVKSKVPNIERIEKQLRKIDLTEEFSITIKKAVSEVQIYELIKMLDDNNLTSLQHNILQEALQKLKPISTLTPTENHQIQVFIDEVNLILEEFAKIKSYFNSPINRYADDKAGIAIVNEFPGMVTYSLFAVSKKELNTIRELNVDQWRSLANRDVFKFRTTDLKNHILEQPKKVARENIFNYIAKLLSTNALYKSKSDLIATEFIIDFIDQYKIQLGLDFKNEYSIEDLIYSFQEYLPLWIDEALKKADKSVIDRLVKRRGY
ncbi:MAG: HNH endonuclease, partial [Candidatus Hermodarchaeota archaeon]